MPTATTFTAAFIGAEAHIVTIDAVSTDGSPGLNLEGLPDQPARNQGPCSGRILNSGRPWPSAQVTISLVPAALPTLGPAADLAIALAILAVNYEQDHHWHNVRQRRDRHDRHLRHRH